jgi:excisionase family DNA binding protein
MAAQHHNESARQRDEGSGGSGGSAPGSGTAVQFLTVAEVAEIMRVSKMTVYRLVHSGELPAVRVGKSFRVPEQAVHEYLASSYYDADAG